MIANGVIGHTFGGANATDLVPLGNVLFVSEFGSATQTRAEGVGRIDKPFTLLRAVQVCQDFDNIVVFSINNTDFLSYGGTPKNWITIYTYIYLYTANLSGLPNLTIIGMDRFGALATDGNTNRPFSESAVHFENVSYNYTGTLRLFNLMVSGFINFSGGSNRIEVGNCFFGCGYTNLNNTVINTKNLFYNTTFRRTTNFGSSSYRLRGIFYFKNCHIQGAMNLQSPRAIFRECVFTPYEINSTNPIFSTSTGTEVPTNILIEHSRIELYSEGIDEWALVGNTNPAQVPNLEIEHSTIYTGTGTILGRTPTAINNCIIKTGSTGFALQHIW